MNFLAPAFLLGLLALGVPLALHLLRRRVVRTVPFPALRFLAATRADENKNKLRRRVVLALRCLALALLAAAFARPFLGAPPTPTARATVVVIDNSFSLQAANRWPELLRRTREQLGTLAPDDSLGLLLMNPRPTWLVAPTRDTASALAALTTLAPGWESTRAEPALRLAGDVLATASARERHLIYLGDHQAQGWVGTDFAKPLPPGVALSFPPPAPPPTQQAALLSASLDRENDAWTLVVNARRFAGATARTLSIFAETATTPLLTAPLVFDASDSVTLRLSLPSSANALAWLRLALEPDDLAADDTLWVVAPSRQGDRHLLLDRPSDAHSADYLATAYQTLATLPPTLRISPLPSFAWPLPAVAVLRNDASFAGETASRLDAFLAAGGSALLFLDNGSAQRAWLARHHVAPASLKLNSPSSTAAQPLVARLRDWTLDHPLVAPLAEQNLRALVGWEFSRAMSLPADVVDPLAFWEDGTIALGEFSVGPGRVLVAGWSPDRAHGDWPLNPAFLPFLHHAATHLFGLTTATSAPAPRVGAAIVTPTPGTWRALAGPAATAGPSNSKLPVSSFHPPAPGVYEFTTADHTRRLYAVGLAPDESDLSPWPEGSPWLGLASTEKVSTPAVESPRAASLPIAPETQDPLWWWALAAVSVFLLTELALANRTAR